MAGRKIDNTEAADTASLELSPGYIVRRTHRSFLRCLEKRLARHDISISMWFFVRLLWIKDGLTQKELGDQLGLTQPTTVTAMDNMERRGFIVRQRNLGDRRKINIQLTASGRAMEKKLSHYADEVNGIAWTGFSPEEKNQLISLLLRANQSLVDEMKA